MLSSCEVAGAAPAAGEAVESGVLRVRSIRNVISIFGDVATALPVLSVKLGALEVVADMVLLMPSIPSMSTTSACIPELFCC